MESGYLILELEGLSAHGMEPDKGKNAGILLANFLTTIDLDEYGKALPLQRFTTFLKIPADVHLASNTVMTFLVN